MSTFLRRSPIASSAWRPMPCPLPGSAVLTCHHHLARHRFGDFRDHGTGEQVGCTGLEADEDTTGYQHGFAFLKAASVCVMMRAGEAIAFRALGEQFDEGFDKAGRCAGDEGGRVSTVEHRQEPSRLLTVPTLEVIVIVSTCVCGHPAASKPRRHGTARQHGVVRGAPPARRGLHLAYEHQER